MLKPVPVEPVLSVKELYTLYYFHHESGYRFAGESHDFWEIIYVDKGRASGINGTEPYTLEKGQIIFHHPNVFHNFRTDGAPDAEDGADCDIFVVSFNGELEMLEREIPVLEAEKAALEESLSSGSLGVDELTAQSQRIVELIYAVPEMLVVLLIATALKPILTEYINSPGGGPLKSFANVLGPNLISMFIAFGLLYWVTMSRIIRGQVLQLKQQEYVTAARALGASGGRIIRRHLLPNCIGQIVVTTCLQIPSAIFLESFLSYLGVGVSAPLPSLGSMATDALSGMYTYTYRLIVPSVVLSVMILAFNLFGDGLRDALDPKLKK